MKKLSIWFQEYGISHQNIINQKIHKICVPLIMWSAIGMISTIPVPQIILAYGLNFAHIVMVFILLFYLALGTLPFQIMLLASVIMFSTLSIINKVGLSVLWLSMGIFLIAWGLQLIGHKIEGRKPSFLTDLQFLLIGPLWVVYTVLKIDPSKTSTRRES